jgi:histidinol-phosphate aminotransferase
MASALAALPGAVVFPSDANFLLVRFPDAAATYAHLLRERILVKDVSGHHPMLRSCLRITIGTPGENDLLLEALARQPHAHGVATP